MGGEMSPVDVALEVWRIRDDIRKVIYTGLEYERSL